MTHGDELGNTERWEHRDDDQVVVFVEPAITFAVHRGWQPCASSRSHPLIWVSSCKMALAALAIQAILAALSELAMSAIL
jgi:hypothetical protein